MKPTSMRAKSGAILAGALLSWFTFSYAQQPADSPKSSRTGESAHGRQIFASSCSGCHGLDGNGSERAPNIVTNPRVEKLSPEELLRVVSQGVPGTGMPAFRSLGRPAIAAVVAYLGELEGKTNSAPLAGDPKRGAAVFFGAAQCSTCHMARGKGGFMGPDLTTYGQSHAADEIKAAIANPAARDPSKGALTTVTMNGARYEGIVKNEDNFSLQLQSADGVFHFFSKADLTSIERSSASIMPSDYGSRLSEAELNDLVNYLISLSKTSQSDTPADRDDD
jgi:putative heme-binding domain-containing protein